MAQFFVTDARREGKPFLFAVAVIAALGGFLFGYDTGIIGQALPFVQKESHPQHGRPVVDHGLGADRRDHRGGRLGLPGRPDQQDVDQVPVRVRGRGGRDR